MDNFLDFVMRYAEEKLVDGATLQIWAYNGSRFDHVLLLPRLMEKWSDVKILGTPTDIKGLYFECVRGIKIQFCDICLALGGGSLEENAHKFDVPGKLYERPPVDILQLRDWYEISEELRATLRNYCRRDVFSATLLLIRFNDYCEDIARELHTGRAFDPLDPIRYPDALYICNSLSQTAHKIVHKHVRTQPLYLIDDIEIYRAMRRSYRGGICQLTSTQRHVAGPAM